MSVVRGFGLNGKSLYTNVVKPQEVWCNFIVDSTNGNGLGIRSLKSNGYVESVFMHTTQTAGVINGFTNPNPLAGFALIRLKNNFNYYLGGLWGAIPPTTSNSTTSLTTGHVYVITLVGTTTTANWQAVGLLPGVTPAVGCSFVATATASITGSGTVGIPGVPTVNSLVVVGDPNVSLNNSNVSTNAGAQILVQFTAPTFTGTALGNHTHTLNLKNAAVVDGATTRVNAGSNLLGANTGSDITVAGAGANGGIANASAGTPAGTMSFAVTAPADSTVIAMQLCFDASSVTIDGI